MSARILIIDDEDSIRFSLKGIFEDEGHEVLERASAEEGLKCVDVESPDLVFLDIWLPGMDGLMALDHIQALHQELPVIMISGHATIETAVTAIRQGAYDFIEKPLSLEKVLITANRAIETVRLRRENKLLRTVLPEESEFIGQSPVILKFKSLLSQVAPTDAWVLLTGENGTGKELAAQALHKGSSRYQKPFIAVNCAAIPEELIESELFGHEKGAFTGADASRAGRFELAHKGTLFLDEIGDMSLKTQAKILRILQEQCFEKIGSVRTIKVDVRVIAATNKNLEDAISDGTFRQDLYYRLRVVPLHLPPLRERDSDIELLLNRFVIQLSKRYRREPPIFLDEVFPVLKQYCWPGNVRELLNFVERMVILYSGKKVCLTDLPQEMHTKRSIDPSKKQFNISQEISSIITSSDIDFKQAKIAFETKFLTEKLHAYQGNITRLAEAIGLERSYLYRKLKSYGIYLSE
ncbi:sigma-54 dependent transcriptional regulator [Lawsonia intracellularis]|uniref:Response regulator containing CheY-like receiver, AAA-type ATPase, and DNA-binding domains n=1 Tax=Lawsonia intracellularis (strain PHE/MN1-00) TaxID=363253 RepID=Q1MQI6_LAWIP|nr:sigma-54 dependent transcriptional regulator [Lawsonia intracellularis]AGC50110.1 Fis family transcriptional regulator [Lawsonia intracellularis N343]KAA0204805.1 sigma-54-dependent Fis family transcriptional regulator [Lawsonia intracellularis]MBZ3892548.1 sigma-54 dependent transcriptional regulator [Lawsonia intracellularis]OMQ03255.1 Fis family transcriptional regulator [Lawsonia intracellularis]RBN33280.1 sigma-54-dependent Fis family transcriptional regulator [Lawsonia intracellularis